MFLGGCMVVGIKVMTSRRFFDRVQRKEGLWWKRKEGRREGREERRGNKVGQSVHGE